MISKTTPGTPSNARVGQRPSRLDVDAIRNVACERWRSTIYPTLGIEIGNGKHIPCPHCGGRDRFRCDDQNGSGSYFCNQCGAGDGLSLVMKVRGCTFLEAVRRVAGVLGCDGRTNDTPNRQPIIQRPQKLDLVAVAYRFEMTALDRRLRADAALRAVADFSGDNMSDDDRDRLMNVVARALDDKDYAEFLEHVADGFRLRAFHEKKEVRHAA